MDVAARLSKALDVQGTHTAQDVVDAVENDIAQLWLRDDAAIVTRIEQHPRERHLVLWLAGGALESIIDMEDELLDFGRKNGCARMTMAGRPGWRKPLERLGWSMESVTMAREV